MLEDELGTKLFYRNGRGVSLTPEGSQFLQATHQHIEAIEQAKQDIRARCREPSGSLRFGWTGAVSGPIGADIITAFARQFPRVELQTVGGSSDQLVELINDQRLDLAIVNSERRASESNSEHLMSTPLVCVAQRSDADDEQPETITFTDVVARPLLLHGRQHALRRAVELCARENGFHLSIAAQIDELMAVRNLVNEGIGSGILTLDLINKSDRKDFSIRRIVEPEINLYFCLIFPKLQRTPLTGPLSGIVRTVVQEAVRAGRICARL
jgi:LysR family nitrogen assimilation transcriptional regulator